MWCYLLPLLVGLLAFAVPEEMVEVPIEVITDGSPCSATCGLGVKTQTLCTLRDSKTAVEENVGSKDGAEVSEKCRVRKVKCQESWQCGLRTMTVTAGQRVDIDCLGEVMETMGRFSWRVSWRFARGIISSDDSLFTRWEAPQLDRITLDPVREQDAGTYRCDVQDAAFRRVKRAYWGVRVLPVGVLNLDYESSEARWDQAEVQQDQPALPLRFPHMVGISLAIAGVLTGLVGFCLMKRIRRGRGGDIFSKSKCCTSASL